METRSVPQLVRGSFKNAWLIAPLVLGLGLSVLTIVLGARHNESAYGFGILAGAALLAAAVAWGWLLLVRRWITPTESGFDWHGLFGLTSIRVEQVAGLSLFERRVFSQGVPTDRALLRAAVWHTAAGNERRLSMEYKYPLSVGDRLGDLWNRLAGDLFARLNNAVESGADAEGAGWWISRSGLSAGKSKQAGRQDVVPFSEIAAWTLADDQVRVWRRGEDEAFLKTPIDSRNAFVLPQLLNAWVPESARSEELPSDGLGRVIFERTGRQYLVLAWTAVVLCAGLTIGLAAATVVNLGTEKALGSAMVSVFFAGVTAALAYVLARVYASRFRCHELGISQRILAKGERRIRFDEMKSFQFQATRTYVNGAYAGTNIQMQFTPREGIPVKVAQSFKDMDQSLNKLRDHVAGVIYHRMLAELGEGREVPWTNNMTFLPEGLRIVPRGLLGRKEPTMIPFDQIGERIFGQGMLEIHVRGQKKAAIMEQCGVDNFYPGYLLLERILAPGTEPAAPADDPAA